MPHKCEGEDRRNLLCRREVASIVPSIKETHSGVECRWRGRRLHGCVAPKREGIDDCCSMESTYLLLADGRHYNLERVVRSSMRRFHWRRSTTIEMSIIGRHVHRLIVIALVIGLSVGTCCSSDSLADLAGGRHGAQAAAAGTTSRVCPRYRTGHCASLQCWATPQIVAELSDLEEDAHERDGSGVAGSSAIICPRTHLPTNASRRVTSTYSPTLHSLGICWRV